jgi:O-methyltransferase
MDAAGWADLDASLRATRVIAGDLIECGSWRCGTSIRMALAADRRVIALDSFEGFDRAELQKELEAGLTSLNERSFASTPFDYVTRKVRVLGLQTRVIPTKGYFRDTLPHLQGPFSLGLIDCDMGESVRFCSETVWPRLSAGGHLLFDDYTAYAVREAVDEFVRRHTNEIAFHGMERRLYLCEKARS